MTREKFCTWVTAKGTPPVLLRIKLVHLSQSDKLTFYCVFSWLLFNLKGHGCAGYPQAQKATD